MTLTFQLAVWLSLCVPGWFIQMVLSYRTFGRLSRFQVYEDKASPLVEGTFNQFVFESIGVAMWSMYLAIGLMALFDTNTTPPIGQTLIGQLIVWALLTGLGMATAQTVFSFVVGIRQQRRADALVTKRHEYQG